MSVGNLWSCSDGTCCPRIIVRKFGSEVLPGSSHVFPGAPMTSQELLGEAWKVTSLFCPFFSSLFVSFPFGFVLNLLFCHLLMWCYVICFLPCLLLLSFFILINLSFIFFHLVALCFYSPLFSSHLKYFFPLVLFTMKLLSNEFPITWPLL